MDYFNIMFMCVLLLSVKSTATTGEIITEIDEILDRKLQDLKDLSSCSGELAGYVNEASVLSISVEDIIDQFRSLATETENEIQIYNYMKSNISEINKEKKTDHGNSTGSDVPEIENAESDVPAIQLPQLQPFGTCFRNTWARNYYDGSEMGHSGLTWKSGNWQRSGRSKDGQLGLRLRSISLSGDVGVCYITGIAVLEDGTIAATDRNNFALSLYNLDGVKLKDLFFEPLLLKSVTTVPGQTRKVILSVTLLDNMDAKILVDIDDGARVIRNETAYTNTMSQQPTSETKIKPNCTVNHRGIWGHRQFYRSPSGDSFYGTYNQDNVLQFDVNCNYKGVFARMNYRHRIAGLAGIADMVMVQFDRGGRQLHDDRVTVYKIP